MWKSSGISISCTAIWASEREDTMKRRIAVPLFAAALLLSASAQAQITKDTIKIGVLADMSSLYADLGGPGALLAAKMAAEDFGGTVLGKKVEVIGADHQNKPDVGADDLDLFAE